MSVHVRCERRASEGVRGSVSKDVRVVYERVRACASECDDVLAVCIVLFPEVDDQCEIVAVKIPPSLPPFQLPYLHPANVIMLMSSGATIF
jgi:hypothetical protein